MMNIGRYRLSILATALACLFPPFGRSEVRAQEPDASVLTIDGIYQGKRFAAKTVSARWIDGQAAYTTLEPSKESKDRRDLVQYDAETGERSVLVAANALQAPDHELPLEIESYAFSADRNRVLIFTNSKRVWRNNTRGDYWVYDRTSKTLTQLGGDERPSTMMFAKFSPSGRHVAFVRNRDIYVQEATGGPVRRLTMAENKHEINGTTDWAYEEEFGLRDGFHWSPDGKRMLFWQVNTKGVGQFTLINNTDWLYPRTMRFAYPKVGQKNPSCRVGVIDIANGDIRWMKIPGDDRDHYLPRAEWAANSNELLVQQLNRLQNENRVYLADAGSGESRLLYTEKDDAWVDMNDELFWTDAGQRWTWLSDRDGWRHVYLASRRSDEMECLTPGDYDVIKLLHIDEANKQFYFIASPDNATERYLYRGSLEGGRPERVTPEGVPGVHDYRFSDDSQWAIHSYSHSGAPPTIELISMPDHKVVRVLESNEELVDKLKPLNLAPVEFFKVTVEPGVELDGWCIKPANLDPQKKHPLLVYVYGEPAGSTVINRWGGSSYLWHAMLAQRGYVVMSFDNRGTKAPRGRAFRKSVYENIGILPPKDQAAAVRAVLKDRPYLDADRVGIWGWSGGGSSSLQAVFKYPELYHTAIAVAPVPNQLYYDTMYQERYMGMPETNADGYREGSPIHFAKNLKGNLLLVHGTGDDNCHYQTVELLIDELIAHNKQFSLMAYPNRTHSIRERENTTRHLRALMTRFLETNLPASAP